MSYVLLWSCALRVCSLRGILRIIPTLCRCNHFPSWSVNLSPLFLSLEVMVTGHRNAHHWYHNHLHHHLYILDMPLHITTASRRVGLDQRIDKYPGGTRPTKTYSTPLLWSATFVKIVRSIRLGQGEIHVLHRHAPLLMRHE